MVTNMISQLRESFPLRRAAGSFEISFTKKKSSCLLCRNFISIYKINRTLHRRLGIRIFIFKCWKYVFPLSWEILSALEEKIGIPKRPCNILYIFISFLTRISHTCYMNVYERYKAIIYCALSELISVDSSRRTWELVKTGMSSLDSH